jgi:HPt (histidine-containing phosphotransfer) domain-containing protein
MAAIDAGKLAFQTLLGRIQAFVSGADACSLEREAHALNGATAIVGCSALNAVVCELEREARAGDLARAAGRAAELAVQFERLKAVMAKDPVIGGVACVF